MQNPWQHHDFEKDGNILEADINIIHEFNRLQDSLGNDKMNLYKIHEEVFPAPFMGDVFNAKVLLLMLNPGYDNQEANKGFYNRYRETWIKHITSQPNSQLPLFCFETEYKKDSDYWYNKLRYLTPEHLPEDKKFDVIKQNVAVIQFMPYHSQKYKDIPKKIWKPEQNDKYLLSQRYNFYIVEKAMERKALILVLRGRKRWEKAIPRLADKSYNHIGYTNSPQNIALTKKNLGNYYAEVMKKLNYE